jgi:hypothetical protein
MQLQLYVLLILKQINQPGYNPWKDYETGNYFITPNNIPAMMANRSKAKIPAKEKEWVSGYQSRPNSLSIYY